MVVYYVLSLLQLNMSPTVFVATWINTCSRRVFRVRRDVHAHLGWILVCCARRVRILYQGPLRAQIVLLDSFVRRLGFH